MKKRTYNEIISEYPKEKSNIKIGQPKENNIILNEAKSLNSNIFEHLSRRRTISIRA